MIERSENRTPHRNITKEFENPIDRCELVLPNYELYVSSMDSGGGVATYIHESLSSVLVETLLMDNFQESV